jgi:hypothetical protein
LIRNARKFLFLRISPRLSSSPTPILFVLAFYCWRLEIVRRVGSGCQVETVGQYQPKPREHQELLFHFWIGLGISLLGTFRRLSKALAHLLSTTLH